MPSRARVGSRRPTVRVDRRVLVADLVSGAAWLSWPTLLGAWGLALIGAAYVAVAGILLAVVYGRDEISVRTEVLAWVTPWVAAMALWAWVGTWVGGGTGGPSGLVVNLWFGAVLGTASYLGWQVLAFCLRHVTARKDAVAHQRG